ncbi:hypothetical protein VE03_10875 [Pseudogymnoascus sp. 23342-1-I1]|nr:hypothetical protein VE03_10875 [Pseudogymnoascus sp. 23342-1-I1]
MAKLYHPLDPGRREIRLLRLTHSPSFSSPLRGQLIHAPLASPPTYETISYVWGSPNFTRTIELDAHRFSLTPHLELALRHLRLTDRDRTIWVDAVCINQGDLAERGEQVMLMKQIYESCTGNLVWLHPMVPTPSIDPEFTDEEDEEGLDEEQKIAKRLAVMEEGAVLFRQIYTRDIASLEPMRGKKGEGAFRRSIPSNDRLADVWLLDRRQVYSLGRLFLSFPLWSRVWVMQELACAPRITLVVGRQMLDWEMLVAFLGDAQYADAFHMEWGHRSVGSLAGTTFSRIKTIQNQRARTQEGHIERMLDVLARFKGCEATDPRDKIYGLLGLTTQAKELVVDYRKSVAEVYTDVAILEINASANLDIITQNPFQGFSSSAERLPNLPSWVPDFSCADYDDFSTQYSNILFAQRDIYRAGRAACSVPCAVQIPGPSLRLRGTMVGRVGPLLFDAWAHHEYTVDEPDWKLQILHKYMMLYLSPNVLDEERAIYVNRAGSELQAFWRTLVGDCVAYPIWRLDSKQIAEDDVAFREIIRQPLTEESDYYSSMYSLHSGRMMDKMSNRWMFAKADNGLFLMVRKGVREGDMVVVVEGGKVPLLLREMEVEGEDERYTVVNAVYVHGFMDGEARTGVDEGRLSEREFLVV